MHAVLTSAVTVAGTKLIEEAAGEAGKRVWAGLMKLFGWNEAPALPDLARVTAEHLQAHPEHAGQVLQLLREESGAVALLVGHIDAEKVVVAHNINTINM